MDRLMKYITVILFLLTSACSTDYYKPVSDNDVAYVSFSNLSREIPEISINTNCKRSRIDPELIQYRKPSEHADLLLQIPSNVPVSFGYDYAWFEGEQIDLVTTGASRYNAMTNQLTHRRSLKEVKSCVEMITFTPEPNKRYEVYFGKNPQSCVIGVSEAFFEPTSQKKHLLKVKTVARPEC